MFMEPEFVRVLPVDYQPTNRKYPRIVIPVEIEFNENLTQEQMDFIAKNIKLKKEFKAISNPDNFIFCQYGEEPLIILDLNDNQILTTRTVIEHYGIKRVQQQASIILNYLKKYGLVKFRTRTISMHKLGTIEEMKERIEAYARLWNKNIKIIEG
jgi:hypothetical protein